MKKLVIDKNSDFRHLGGKAPPTRDQQSEQTGHTFNYERNAGICDALREMLKGFASIGSINSVDAYNLALAGAEVQREYDKKHGFPFEKMWRETQAQFNKMEARAILLEKALIECRDILCALNTTDAAIKLAYMKPRQIPIAIERGYVALGYPVNKSLPPKVERVAQ